MEVITNSLLKNIDQSKVSPIKFNFVDVAEDIWDDLLENMTEEEACKSLQKKVA